MDQELSVKQLCDMVKVSWDLSEVLGRVSEGVYKGQSFVANFMEPKLKGFGLDVVIPNDLYIIIDLCTEGNPGMAQLMVKEILEGMRPVQPGSVVSLRDFVRVHGSGYPILATGNSEFQRYSQLWREQKLADGSNGVDTAEYWLEVLSPA